MICDVIYDIKMIIMMCFVMYNIKMMINYDMFVFSFPDIKLLVINTHITRETKKLVGYTDQEWIINHITNHKSHQKMIFCSGVHLLRQKFPKLIEKIFDSMGEISENVKILCDRSLSRADFIDSLGV